MSTLGEKLKNTAILVLTKIHLSLKSFNKFSDFSPMNL